MAQNLPSHAAPKSPLGRILRVVHDGWQNVLTGLGIQNLDKRVGSRISYQPLLETEAEELYAGDDIAERIVRELPEEAFREGYDITFKEEDPDLVQSCHEYFKDLQVNEKFLEAWCWARLYGGAALIPLPENLLDLVRPMPDQLMEVKSLLLLQRYELQWQVLDYDVRSPNFGLPLIYMIQPHAMMSNANSIRVHHSWVLRFGGAPLPRNLFVRNNYWDDSVLTKAQTAIMNYNISHDAAATALQDFSVSVYKLKNLAEMIAEDGPDGGKAILARMQIVNAARSIARCVVIDAEGESYETQSRTLTGVADILEKAENRLVAASKMPHTKILGESPKGLGASGHSEETDWYNYVKAKQGTYADPKLQWVHETIFRSRKGPTQGKIPEGYKRVWKPLWQLDEVEQSQVRLNNSQSDEINIQFGIYDADDVALSRYSGKYENIVKAKPRAQRPVKAQTPNPADVTSPVQKPGMKDVTKATLGSPLGGSEKELQK